MTWKTTTSNGRPQWVSNRGRFSILEESKYKYHLVDLDTYNECTERTLEDAKAAAERMRTSSGK